MTPLAILTAVFNTFWQAAALAVLVWLGLKFVRMNAATRCAIWWVVLTVLLVLPFAPRPGALWNHPRVQAAAPVFEVESEEPAIAELPAIVTLPEKPARKWPGAIFWIWAVVLIYRLARICQSYLYLRRVKRDSGLLDLPLPDAGRDARVLLSADIASPMAVGFRHAAVILPEDLIERITSGELDQILLHESAHLARRDDWWNLLARLLGAALTLHPVAWWILRQIEYEREAACDDWVVARTGAVRPYAETLAHMAELRWKNGRLYHTEEVLASGVFGRGSRIGNRIEDLLEAGRQFSARVSVARVIASCFALCCLAAAGTFAPRWVAFAQAPQPLQFEVASVRLSPAGTAGGIRMTGGPGTSDPGRIAITRASLESLVLIAYDLQTFQVTGPDWLIGNFGPSAVKVDVNATLPPGTTKEQFHVMLQNLLVERFRLVIRREKKEMMIYDLVVAKNGPKFSPAQATPAPDEGAQPPGSPGALFNLGLDHEGFPNLPPEGGMRAMGNRGRMHFPHYTMEQLANFLTLQAQRPVTDATGLQGEYDVGMFWGGDEGADGSVTIEEAVQDQLGLKLESKKGQADVFMIDHIEKAPTEN